MLAIGGNRGGTVFALVSPHHFATEGVALELHAITDAEHGDGAGEQPFGKLGCAVVIDAGWPS